ncbi:aminoglycoside phosphotransferase family protein [Streptomyces massasporeus]|uniref:Aminoglycoside phosphotransferase family protein n=1 Tax=Streptomyces massasporeus TaxID=67324 RepID=A0ABW6LEJ6_9ACTN
MEGFLTPDRLSARTFRARAAAVAAGRELGLDVGDARVVHDVFSVVVHLAPPPVVVRVPAVPPSYADAESRAARQRREPDVVGWLADQGHPVIPPSPLVPREPVTRDGFSMTFWQFAEPDQGAEPDCVRHAGPVADLHAALRSYPGVLPFLSAAEPRFVTEGLAALEGRPDLLEPADLDRARREWEVLEPVVGSRAGFEAVFPGVGFQPIQRDASAANIVSGSDGVLYRLRTDHARAGRVGSGGLRPRVRGRVRRRRAPGAAPAGPGRAAGRQRGGHVPRGGLPRARAQLPLLVDALKPAVERWRTMPFAGGLAG